MASQNLKKIKYDNKEVQVESAIRDGSGRVISSTYQTKVSVNTGTGTTDLTTITIDGITYSISGGSAIPIIDLR